MSLETSYDAAKNATLQKRVIAAIYKAAQNVASESPAGKGQTEYLKRQELAYRVKNQGEQLVSQWSMSLCSGGIITNASDDGDIEFTVNAQWDAFAGVTDLDRVQP